MATEPRATKPHNELIDTLAWPPRTNRVITSVPMHRMSRASLVPLLLISVAGLLLRLLVWHWREFQPLGGDEQEYLNQALTLLRERDYAELRFMRPPLYTLFLAGIIYLGDSLLQQLRLVQALLSAATVPFVYLLTLEVARWFSVPAKAERAALIAAALSALSFTLAASATELLSETLFLFGLTVTLWLLLRAVRQGSWIVAALAGLGVGALCLVRSVALPLLPLGLLWLLFGSRGRRILPSFAFVGMVLLLMLPWSVRNYMTYGGLILIDTTGAENLWLDNDPLGREFVKAKLYAMGEDRLARQQLASRRGIEVIVADPERFASKAWRELRAFFALEQSDDMVSRRAIWVSPGETWVRLLLGDLNWLIILLVGGYGLARTPWIIANVQRRPLLLTPSGLLTLWALYVLLTTLIFHVELRYRLPLYPALLPYAGLSLAAALPLARLRTSLLSLLVPLVCVTLMLLHAAYPTLAWQLGRKHWHLAQAELALIWGNPVAAWQAADTALSIDEDSALARITLARIAAAAGNLLAAGELLDAAILALPDHAQSHVLRGDLRRALGDSQGAQADLASERATRQDLQHWLWTRAVTPAPTRLDLGGGLDLGFVRGVHAVAADENGIRWTTGHAQVRLAVLKDANELRLRIASGRPPAADPVTIALSADGIALGEFTVGSAWQELRVALERPPGALVVIELRTPTFTPRDIDPASPDGRRLGVQLDWIELGSAP